MRIIPLSLVPIFVATAACGDDVAATPPSSLQTTVATSLHGDRTAACVAVAVIGETIERAIVCADPLASRGLDATTAFEIGSISKTMTGFAVASLVAKGALAIDAELTRYLPTGTTVPSFAGQAITLKNLVTHTAGLPPLPSRLTITNPANPYVGLSESELLLSLGDVQLQQAPGTTWAYSNFGFMVLSTVVTRASGGDLQSLLARSLFEPLGMSNAYISQPPPATATAIGHLPGGLEVDAWDFPDAIAGVGGVRASLNDMILYAEAVLGRGDPEVVATVASATLPLLTPVVGPTMAMGWPVLTVGTSTIVAHDGGTGGFSSFLVVDQTRKRAVVVLADTSIASVGFTNELALHLLDPALAAAPTPRLVATPPAALLQQLVGRYRIDELDTDVALTVRNGTLYVIVDGLPDTALSYDNHGDFFPINADALLTPVRQPDGSYNIRYTSDGIFEAVRIP